MRVPLRLTKPNKYSQDELRLMKTQDVKYLVMKERTEAEVRVRGGRDASGRGAETFSAW